MRLLEPWNAWYRLRRPYAVRRASDVRYLVLHHTAGPSSQPPEVIRAHHESVRRWPHIGYHYLIYEDGRVYKTLPNSAIPICVRQYNPVSICVALVGDFTKEGWPRDAKGWEALAQLRDRLRRAYPRAQLVLHRDLTPTECPGRATWEGYGDLEGSP